MRFSIHNLSPLVKSLIGIAFILISFIIDNTGGYGALKGFLEGLGFTFQLLAAIGLYEIYKEKKSNKS